MSDLNEAMAVALFKNDDRYKNCVWQGLPDRLQAMFRSDATAALAALRETHHLVPKDQEPVGYWYDGPKLRVGHFWKNRMQKESIRAETETPLYALEKRHD